MLQFFNNPYSNHLSFLKEGCLSLLSTPPHHSSFHYSPALGKRYYFNLNVLFSYLWSKQWQDDKQKEERNK